MSVYKYMALCYITDFLTKHWLYKLQCHPHRYSQWPQQLCFYLLDNCRSSCEKEAPFSVRVKSISHYSVPEGNGLEGSTRNNLIYYGNTDPWMCLFFFFFLLLCSEVKYRWNCWKWEPKQQRKNKLLMIEKTSLGYSDGALLKKKFKKRKREDRIIRWWRKNPCNTS